MYLKTLFSAISDKEALSYDSYSDICKGNRLRGFSVH